MSATRALRIGLVAPYDLSRPGGVNNQIRAQARALRTLGHDVQIYGPASEGLADGERSLGRALPVTFGGTQSGIAADPRGVGAVQGLVRERFDVVHVHEPFTPLIPWVVLLRSPGPFVGTFHVHREAGHRLYRAASRALAPLARRLAARIAVSESARQTVAAHFPGEYEIVPNGIAWESFRVPRPRPATMSSARSSVVYVGRLEPRKGVEYLIRAMVPVQARVPDATLVVAGDGPDRERLLRLSAELNAPVIFTGRVTDSEVAAYIQAADIVCSPAVGGESFGVVLLEAMASGKPVVASRIEGYEELIGSAGCARLVPPRDANALARELCVLFENAELRQTLGSRGALFARDYDWDSLARRIERIYRRVV